MELAFSLNTISKKYVIFNFLLGLASCLMCLDPNGNHVDWFSTYKSPKIHTKSLDWKIRAGLAHFYLDINLPEWTLSGQPINESQQQISNTLQQIYKPRGSIMYIMYNDESPTTLLAKGGGHTKGVVAFDETAGFWLIHSVPKFPPVKAEGYSWPDSGADYGQTFLCVSLPYKQLGVVAKQLLYNQPHLYDSSVPAQFLKSFPILNDVLEQKSPPGPPWSSVQKLQSVGSQAFISFAKANKYMADLYDALVAPTLKKNLLVETWLRESGGPLSSNCSAEYKVLKINEINLPNGVEFNETKDHAKWAVTTSKRLLLKTDQAQNAARLLGTGAAAENWACVGDINRMKSQFHRGGGTLCIQHSGVWRAYTGIAAGYVPCR